MNPTLTEYGIDLVVQYQVLPIVNENRCKIFFYGYVIQREIVVATSSV